VLGFGEFVSFVGGWVVVDLRVVVYLSYLDVVVCMFGLVVLDVLVELMYIKECFGLVVFFIVMDLI